MDKARGVVHIPHADADRGDHALQCKGIGYGYRHVTKFCKRDIVFALVYITGCNSFIIGRSLDTGRQLPVTPGKRVTVIIDREPRLQIVQGCIHASCC